MRKILSIFAAMFIALAANAAVINIDNTTADALRLALNGANDGDEIVMAAGTYVESNGNYIAFDGKAVTVKAAEGADVIIQPQVPITVSNGGHAIFENVKIDASHLTDLADWYEHLLYVTDENPNGCTFRGCELYGFNLNSSMFYCNTTNKVAAMKFENCYFHDLMKSIVFVENTAGKPMVSVKNCTFANIATNTESYWAGIIDVRATEATLTVDHCTFYNVIPMNTDFSCVSKITLAKGKVSNCIFMLPTAQDGIRAMRGVTATNCITFNYLKDSGTGIHSSVTQNNCVQVDPLFVNAAEGNFTLGENSPALTMNDGEPIGDPRWVPAAPEAGDPKAIYLKPTSVWSGDGAKFGVYAFQDGLPEYFSEIMTLAENETAIYTTTIPENYYNVVFMRLNDGADHVAWDQIWNQSVDLAIPEGMDMFTITGWDGEGDNKKGVGDWSLYVYEEPAKFYITGSANLVGEDKQWTPDALKVMEDSYTFENLAAGKYQLKVTEDGQWATAKGIADMTEVAGNLYRDQDGNVCFILAEAGNVTVTYTAEAYTLAGNFATPEIKLIGINGWNEATDAIVLSPADDHMSASVILNLTGTWYDFKVIRAGEWLGKANEGEGNYRIHSEYNWVDGLERDKEGLKSISLQPNGEGDYIFTYDYAAGKLTVTFPGGESAINNTAVEAQVVKMVENGQLVIIKNGVKYNAQGAIVK